MALCASLHHFILQRGVQSLDFCLANLKKLSTLRSLAAYNQQRVCLPYAASQNGHDWQVRLDRHSAASHKAVFNVPLSYAISIAICHLQAAIRASNEQGAQRALLGITYCIGLHAHTINAMQQLKVCTGHNHNHTRKSQNATM